MILWYAIALYIVGIAVILYFRPSVMFRDDGVWKEFGISSRENFTVFPFWMFALVWSILSFALANLASLFVASVVAKSSSAFAQQQQSLPQSLPQSQPNFIPSPTFPASVFNSPIPTVSSHTVPGYYVLESATNGPRYVFWGPNPPVPTTVA
jgi:hypothetical protein